MNKICISKLCVLIRLEISDIKFIIENFEVQISDKILDKIEISELYVLTRLY